MVATVIDRTAVAVCGVGLESFACTVKLVAPAAVGVPVITPVALIVKPLGKELPLASEYIYGRIPPVAETLALYAAPWTPFGRIAVVIDTAGVTVMERFAVMICGVELESFTCTAKFDRPAADGVPEINPEGINVRPAGKVPLASEKVSGRLPPLAVTVAL